MKYKELSAKTVAFISYRWSYVYRWWKPQCCLKAPYISSFHWTLSTPVISTDVSQVGVTLFPSQHFSSFHLSRFSFYINMYLWNRCLCGCTCIYLSMFPHYRDRFVTQYLNKWEALSKILTSFSTHNQLIWIWISCGNWSAALYWI